MQNSIFSLLALGDVVGDSGVDAVCKLLPALKRKYSADLVVVNGENSAETYGMTKKSALEIFGAGADVITGGNHSLRNYEIFDMLDENDRLLRPINFPPSAPGHGWYIADGPFGLKILVISAIGQVFMGQYDSPFTACDRLLKELSGKYDLAVCDFHAEATSEKNAFAQYFDGRINVVFGTHTHIQTADKRFLKNGSGFVTDIGMCGVTDSVLGVKSEVVIKQFTTGISERYEKAQGVATVHGALFKIDLQSKKVIDIIRIKQDNTERIPLQ